MFTQEVQLARGSQWYMETPEVWNEAVTLNTVQMEVKPREGSQLLEELCLEGAQLTEQERAVRGPCQSLLLA